MDRRILSATLGLTLASLVGFVAACAKTTDVDAVLAQDPTEPDAEAPKPLPASNPAPKPVEAGAPKDAGHEAATPPPPPPPDPADEDHDGETCDPGLATSDPTVLANKTGDCPCTAGDCCLEVGFGSFAYKFGCVPKPH